jgi:uncharacterized protein (DUF4415 family)
MKKKPSSNTSTVKRAKGSDFERLARMKPDEIDLSDVPEVTAEEFARGVVRYGLKPPLRKTQVTLRLDSDVLEWFRARGKGYQTEMNALLRAYVEAQRKAG